MPRREVRDEHCAAKLHLVAIVQDTIYLSRPIQKSGIVAVSKVTLAAGFHHANVRIHHHVHRAGLLFDHRAPGIVIPVRVADQKNLCVLELESELLDTRLN